MPCVYFQAVTDPKRKTTAGVVGYCLGDSEGKLRIPSMEEYERYCVTNRQAGCCVFDFHAQGEVSIVVAVGAHLSENAKS